MKEIKRNWNKTIGGKLMNLSHLKPHTIDVKVEAVPTRGFKEVNFRIHVRYSSHCISWGAKHKEKIDFNKQGADYKVVDEKGHERCFCHERYTLSLNLPSIIKEILNKSVFRTSRDNWLIIEVINYETGARQEYDIFFSLTKRSDSMLNLFVESAYVRTEGVPPPHIKKRSKIQAKKLFISKLSN